MVISSDSTLFVCHSENYISVQELYDFCHIPGACGHGMECEGKIALVKGVIDYGNVFDTRHYPQLPYEKFIIHDQKGGQAVEVWAVASDNNAIFDKIYQHINSPETLVFITGTLVGFDMPIMEQCERGIKLELDESQSIVFE